MSDAFTNMFTPDGLLVTKQEPVGLVVSAAEHNYRASEWAAEKAKLLKQINDYKTEYQALLADIRSRPL